jgi:hypothetical protein
VLNTLALVGGLCLIVVAQFILFPLVVTYLTHDPRTGLYLHVTPNVPPSIVSDTLHGFSTHPMQQSNQQRRQNRRRKGYDLGSADGTFNGAPIIYRENVLTPRSRIHCVGENYRTDAWMHRSCQYSMLCFNTSDQKFVVFQTMRERLLSVYLAKRPFAHSSTTLLRYGSNRTNSVALGGLNQKWSQDGISRLEWMPEIRVIESSNETMSYYELPSDVVLIPYHSLNAANPGHLIWDDFLPMFTLLSMFQLTDRDVLPLRMVLQDGQRGLWASCDHTDDKRQACQAMIDKFVALLLGDDSPYQVTSSLGYSFQTRGGPARSELVCARTAVAGMGTLTDHGAYKSHGWEEADYAVTHNHGRGGLLYEFRNYMLTNLGLPTHPRNLANGMTTRRSPHRIVFSIKSSDIMVRHLDFTKQSEQVRQAFPNEIVESYTFKELSVKEQLEIASGASVYITLCGGGAVTAMFLPKGSSVIVYYSESSGFHNGRPSGTPALLDWDLFNSMSHLRVHWLPRNTMSGKTDGRALTLLIEHELEIIDSQALQ